MWTGVNGVSGLPPCPSRSHQTLQLSTRMLRSGRQSLPMKRRLGSLKHESRQYFQWPSTQALLLSRRILPRESLATQCGLVLCHRNPREIYPREPPCKGIRHDKLSDDGQHGLHYLFPPPDLEDLNTRPACRTSLLHSVKSNTTTHHAAPPSTQKARRLKRRLPKPTLPLRPWLPQVLVIGIFLCTTLADHRCVQGLPRQLMPQRVCRRVVVIAAVDDPHCQQQQPPPRLQLSLRPPRPRRR